MVLEILHFRKPPTHPPKSGSLKTPHHDEIGRATKQQDRTISSSIKIVEIKFPSFWKTSKLATSESTYKHRDTQMFGFHKRHKPFIWGCHKNLTKTDIWWIYSTWMGATKPTKIRTWNIDIRFKYPPKTANLAVFTVVFIHIFFKKLGHLGGSKIAMFLQFCFNMQCCVAIPPFPCTSDSRLKIQDFFWTLNLKI